MQIKSKVPSTWCLGITTIKNKECLDKYRGEIIIQWWKDVEVGVTQEGLETWSCLACEKRMQRLGGLDEDR